MDEPSRHQWIADHILPWEPKVRRWLRSYTRTLTKDDIDDLIQEAYVRIWSADLSAVRNGKTFLFAVVRNALQDQLRRARVVQIESVADLEALPQEETPGPERTVSARQQYERLVELLNELPTQRRAVFSARKFEGLSIRETAKRLGVTEKTVANHLSFALTQLTRLMFGSAQQSESPGETQNARKRQGD